MKHRGSLRVQVAFMLIVGAFALLVAWPFWGWFVRLHCP